MERRAADSLGLDGHHLGGASTTESNIPGLTVASSRLGYICSDGSPATQVQILTCSNNVPILKRPSPCKRR